MSEHIFSNKILCVSQELMKWTILRKPCFAEDIAMRIYLLRFFEGTIQSMYEGFWWSLMSKPLSNSSSPSLKMLIMISRKSWNKQQTLQFVVKIFNRYLCGDVGWNIPTDNLISRLDTCWDPYASSCQDLLQNWLLPYPRSVWQLGCLRIHVQDRNQCLVCC